MPPQQQGQTQAAPQPDWFSQNAPPPSQGTTNSDWFAANAPPVAPSSSNTVMIGGKAVDLMTGAGAQSAAESQNIAAANEGMRQAHGALGLTSRPESSLAQDQSFDAALASPSKPKNPLYLSGPTPETPPGMAATSQIAQGVPAMAGALSAFVPGDIAGQFLARLKGNAAADTAEAWQKANSVLNVKASAIRIGEQATGIEQAATNPGRTLVRLGLDSDRLEAMSPIERQAAIAPELNKAGQAVRSLIDQATASGKTLDIGESTYQVLSKIKGPAQQQAIDALSAIQHEVGISDLRNATPAEAKDFRDALRFGARFNTGGDLSSLGSIRANLYRAASRDLEAAVPGLDVANEAYSDLKGAAGAARNGVARAAVTAPPPSFARNAATILKEKGVPVAIGAGAGVGAAGAYRTLRSLFGGSE